MIAKEQLAELVRLYDQFHGAFNPLLPEVLDEFRTGRNLRRFVRARRNCLDIAIDDFKTGCEPIASCDGFSKLEIPNWDFKFWGNRSQTVTGSRKALA